MKQKKVNHRFNVATLEDVIFQVVRNTCVQLDQCLEFVKEQPLDNPDVDLIQVHINDLLDILAPCFKVIPKICPDIDIKRLNTYKQLYDISLNENLYE
jgi:hypothetical protein